MAFYRHCRSARSGRICAEIRLGRFAASYFGDFTFLCACPGYGEAAQLEIPSRAGLYLHAFGLAADYRRNLQDRKSTRLNSSHVAISYAVFFFNIERTKLDVTSWRTKVV